MADPGSAVQQTLKRVAAALKVTDVVPLTEVLQAGLAQERMLASLTASLGGLAILLAAVGLYGLTAYGIAQRTRELGIRLVLGASRKRVFGEILGEMAVLLAIGLAAGSTAVLAAGRVLTRFLAGLSPHDPLMLSLAAGSLVLVALLASSVAALRALALSPVRALRET